MRKGLWSRDRWFTSFVMCYGTITFFLTVKLPLPSPLPTRWHKVPCASETHPPPLDTSLQAQSPESLAWAAQAAPNWSLLSFISFLWITSGSIRKTQSGLLKMQSDLDVLLLYLKHLSASHYSQVGSLKNVSHLSAGSPCFCFSHLGQLYLWPCNAPSHKRAITQNPLCLEHVPPLLHPHHNPCLLQANLCAYFESYLILCVHDMAISMSTLSWLCPQCLECSRPSLNNYWKNQLINENGLEKAGPKK